MAILVICNHAVAAQSIGTFNSIAPSAQTSSFIIPSTHTFQRIIKSGDALSLGGSLGASLDFTGYVPISGASNNGYLSISSETTPAACAILGISYNYSSHIWNVNNGGNVNFLTAGTFGNTSRFCSGTVTPNNTIIVCEESVTSGDANGDGYEDIGWLIEIDPVSRTVINQDGLGVPDRLWAVGRGEHENAVIKSDNTVLYTGVDNSSTGYLYKFIPTVAGNFSDGLLYVLQTTGAFGNGTWRIVANSTIANRNATTSLSTTAGAYNFNGIEDVEIGPDGKIYFAAKGLGRVYRFTDNGTFGTATDVSGLEVFVGNSTAGITYDVDGPGPFVAESWGIGNDNLAFDNEGNLWVLQDGGRNHIWVVAPSHTQASPQVRLFGKTPTGSEPTGITFTPDGKFMFLSIQHPSVGNSTSQLDAAGNSVIFNTHTTLVIARTENLGPTSTLPLIYNSFEVRENSNGALLQWVVSQVVNHSHFEIERSVDGINFEKIFTELKILSNNNQHILSFTDNNLPNSSVVFYRIKQVEKSGTYSYSIQKSIKVKNFKITLYPVPANDHLYFDYVSEKINNGKIVIIDVAGQTVISEDKKLMAGKKIIQVDIKRLPKGTYTLIFENNESQNLRQKFIKL